MLGDGGLGDAGVIGEHADGLFAVATEALEEGAARGVGEGLEDGVGCGSHREKTHSQLAMGLLIAVWLWIVKRIFENFSLD